VNRRLPIWCSRCTNRTPAAWHVAGRGRAEVACDAHLDASCAWAGIDPSQATPVEQPAEIAAKVARQGSLFDLGEVG
jgi:hypothetical protein